MQLVKATDFNDVTDAFISGVAGVDLIAPGVVRVSFFVEKQDSEDEERRERKIADSQIWSLPQLRENLKIMQLVLDQLSTPKRPELSVVAAMH